MQILITQSGAPYPPAAIGPMNHPNGAHLFDTPIVFTDFWDRTVRPFHTHGYNLIVEEDLDPILRNLLMRCLADLPADRPRLVELNDWLQSREPFADWNDPTDGTKAWCDKTFADAPKVSPLKYPGDYRCY